jgi:uncharacterized protein (DUF885 family)
MRSLLLLVLLVSPSFAAPADDPRGAATSIEDPQLRALLIEHWDFQMERHPTWATELGVHEFDHQLLDGSKDAWSKALGVEADLLARVMVMDPEALTGGDAKAVRLLRRSLSSSLDQAVCRSGEWAVSPRRNPLVGFAYLPETHPLKGAADAEALLARYRAIPPSIDQSITNLRLGLASGRVATSETVRRTIDQARQLLAKPLAEQPLLMLEGDKRLVETTTQKATPLVRDAVLPAFARYVDMLEREVLPNARPDGQDGLVYMPDGRACYAAMVRRSTTLNQPPEALHELGLKELDRIHAEFQVVGNRALNTTELPEIFERLRTDPDLYFDSSEEVEEAARVALARATKAMPEAFGRMPKAECIVRPVPAHEAPFTTIAYYRQPRPSSGKPGEYFVNTYAPETRPRHEAQVLAFHEAIPGHHLERSLALELEAAPAFIRYGGFTAFTEGWGLYSERLSDELGLYSGDIDRLGMLSFDAWRAARLVVDTGIHHFGWSRQQAIDFLMENTPLAANNIDNEVDRYINTPAQALAYKVGQLEFLALRAEAEEALGASFDLRAFHDLVLAEGAMPLPMLRARVEAWIRR